MAYSLRENDGRLQWIHDLMGAGLPSLGDGGLFVTSGCFYQRLSAIDGALPWTNEQCVGGGHVESAYAFGRL